MKKNFTAFLAALLLVQTSWAGLITHTDYTAGATITSAGQNANENAIFNEFNGNVDNTNIKTGGIATANLATNSLTYAKLDANLQLLFSYRRPTLIYVSATTVNIEGGLDGTAADRVVMFKDGTVRTDSTASHYTIDISRVANFTSGTIQSGLRTGTVANNTWYTVYAVKSLANSTDFVGVLDTVVPTQANYATLNSNFGTNGWVYLGTIRYGNSAGAANVINKFMQSGATTVFTNAATGNTSGFGILLSSSTGSASLSYAYVAGTGSAQIPAHLKIVCYTGFVSGTGSGASSVQDGSSIGIVFSQGTTNERVWATVWIDATLGINGTAAGAVPVDLFLNGYIDSVLGVGSNPFL